jgi:membrane associated rhomboid family serine protease
MKPESILCIIGYAIAAMIILSATGSVDSWQAHILGALGAIPLGYWCAHCDMMERRRR